MCIASGRERENSSQTNDCEQSARERERAKLALASETHEAYTDLVLLFSISSIPRLSASKGSFPFFLGGELLKCQLGKGLLVVAAVAAVLLLQAIPSVTLPTQPGGL